MNEDGSGINISLWNNCKSNQTCAHGVVGSGDSIFEKETVNGTCQNSSPLITQRWPGEACDTSNTCIQGTCASGVCTGQTLNQNCTSTTDCVVGHYCNSAKVCVVQLKENDGCTSTWDCANNLGCYNNKCVPWGSQAVGADLNSTTNFMNDTLNQGFKDVGFFCELGQSNSGLVCSNLNYTGTTVAKVDAKTGFATCNWNEDCHYSDGAVTFTQKCGCGYNSAGQGYCPLASAQKSDLFKKQYKRIASQYKNDCHSKGRFNCYKVPESALNDANDAFHLTANAHLLYDAVSCASDVLGSAYINMSVALLAALVAFLL